MERLNFRQFSYCFVLLFSLTICAVQAQPTPFEGANVILITTDLADKEAYLTVGHVLTAHGVSFEPASDHLLISLPASTGEFGKMAAFVGQLSVNAGLVQLTGKMQSTSGVEGSPLVKVTALAVGYPKDKRKAAPSHLGFLYLNEIAKKLYRPLHGTISYKIQPKLTAPETTEQ